MRISVDLPAPSGPTSPVISPPLIDPDTASSAGAEVPKRLVISDSLTNSADCPTLIGVDAIKMNFRHVRQGEHGR